MGKALFDASPAARRVFEAADRALDSSISKLCFEGPEPELTLTQNTQPAIVATSIAALEALREACPSLPTPLLAAGHSLGEYSALVAAGALDVTAAIKLVHLRGRAMQDAVPPGAGAMAAMLGGDESRVRELCAAAAEGQVLSPANFNAAGQVVIAGHADAVRRATESAKEYGLKAIPLKVSAPFHCALMEPAARAVQAALDSVTMSPLAFPVVANVDAKPNDEAGRIAELLVRQIDNPVLWEQSMRRMVSQGVTHALELGAGRVLAGLARKIDKRVEVIGVGDPGGVEKAKLLFA